MMALPTWRDCLFSAKAYLAAMLALYIALALNLPHPSWAMVTAYIVSRPLTGETHAKAIDRIGGVLIGASAAVIITPSFVDTPVLLSLIIALWAGAFFYIASLYRAPRNYVFVAAAVLMPVVALPAMHAPQQIFDIAVERGTETLLGILCPRIVFSLLLPSRTNTILNTQLDTWFNNAIAWAQASFFPPVTQPTLIHHQLATRLMAIDHHSDFLTYDVANPKMVPNVRRLRTLMQNLAPQLSSLSMLLGALRQHPAGIPDELNKLLTDIVEWLRADADTVNDQRYARFLHPHLDHIQPTNNWPQLLDNTIRMQLCKLVKLWHDCRFLQHMITCKQSDLTWQPACPPQELNSEARHHDFGMLLFSAASITLGLFIGCLAWIYSGWADGSIAIIYGLIATAFFFANDEPAPHCREIKHLSLPPAVQAASRL